MSVAVVLLYRSVSEHKPAGPSQDRPEKKQISVKLDMTVYDGLFATFKHEYGFTDLVAGEILMLYALPRRYEAVEEFTRELRRKAKEPSGG